jgi:hypothetical protein
VSGARPKAVTWTPLPAGPHAGKTLPEVIFQEPHFVLDGLEHGKFEGALLEEARRVLLLSTLIRPHRDRRDVVVLYHLNAYSPDQFSGVSVVATNDPRLAEHQRFAAAGSSFLDLGIVRVIAPKDRTALRAMVQRVLLTHFGDPNAKLTRQQAEDFFNDPRCIAAEE